jgi:hypothetical protein
VHAHLQVLKKRPQPKGGTVYQSIAPLKANARDRLAA